MAALLENIEATAWATHSIIFFSAMFLVLVGWVYLPERSQAYRRAEQIPLDDN